MATNSYEFTSGFVNIDSVGQAYRDRRAISESDPKTLDQTTQYRKTNHWRFC